MILLFIAKASRIQYSGLADFH